jgi:hypothetical protein
MPFKESVAQMCDDSCVSRKPTISENVNETIAKLSEMEGVIDKIEAKLFGSFPEPCNPVKEMPIESLENSAFEIKDKTDENWKALINILERI